MPRFFFSLSQKKGGNIYISGEDANHISKALRLVKGDFVTLCDAAKTDYHCKIIQLDKDSVTAEILESYPNLAEPKTNIHLYQCMPKGDKMELIIQKAVELGVHSITPVVSKRCIVPLKSAEKKLDRWQKISTAAAKQSGRGIIPAICPPVSFQQIIQKLQPECFIIAYEKEYAKSVKAVYSEGLQPQHILIGPEGGFEPEEIEIATANGAIAVSLGKRILRTETAGFVLLTLLQHLNGEL